MHWLNQPWYSFLKSYHIAPSGVGPSGGGEGIKSWL